MKKPPALSDSLEFWLDYLERIHPKKIDLDLDRVLYVKNKANINPTFPVLLVGGTNGKGSICKYIESILFESNLKVGCYTSPHINKFNERICINKKEVSDSQIVKAIHYVESSRANTSLTFFEITTLAAMKIFISNKVDICVLEVGLGGRLDAVNIFDPIISLISSISIDHQEYLGNSIEKIGFEKAGILRSKVPGILNLKKIPRSISNYGNEICAKLFYFEKDYSLKIRKDTLIYESDLKKKILIKSPPFISKVQKQNIAGAIKCIEILSESFSINDDEIKKGIEMSVIRGRFEIVSKEPLVICDVAHNYESTKNLIENFKKYKNIGPTRAVFSTLKDKEYEKIIKLFDLVDEWYISELKCTRGLKINELQKTIKKNHLTSKIYTYLTIKNAYESALENSKENDNILIFGSFHTIDESGVIN